MAASLHGSQGRPAQPARVRAEGKNAYLRGAQMHQPTVRNPPNPNRECPCGPDTVDRNFTRAERVRGFWELPRVARVARLTAHRGVIGAGAGGN